MSPAQARTARCGGGTETTARSEKSRFFRTDHGACLPPAERARPDASFAAGPRRTVGLDDAPLPGLSEGSCHVRSPRFQVPGSAGSASGTAWEAEDAGLPASQAGTRDWWFQLAAMPPEPAATAAVVSWVSDPVGADPVADDLRQAVGQDVQVVLVGADGLVERVRRRVVLDQHVAEQCERTVPSDRELADRAAARVVGVGKAARGGQRSRVERPDRARYRAQPAASAAPVLAANACPG